MLLPVSRIREVANISKVETSIRWQGSNIAGAKVAQEVDQVDREAVSRYQAAPTVQQISHAPRLQGLQKAQCKSKRQNWYWRNFSVSCALELRTLRLIALRKLLAGRSVTYTTAGGGTAVCCMVQLCQAWHWLCRWQLQQNKTAAMCCCCVRRFLRQLAQIASLFGTIVPLLH